MMNEENSQKIIIEQLSQNLEDLENYLKDLWQFLPLPLCYLNPLFVILDANLAFGKFLGYNIEELIGEKVERFFFDKEFFKKIFQGALEKKIINEEGIILAKNGEKKIVKISISCRQDENGEIIGYYLAFLDITRLKELQAELEEKVEERTKELKLKVEELEKFHKLAVGRELKMIELKEEIEKLKSKLEKNQP
jgi:PAS domain S-box-containing protein